MYVIKVYFVQYKLEKENKTLRLRRVKMAG